MKFSPFRRGSPEVENLGSEAAATPCPDYDAMTSFSQLSVFRDSDRTFDPTSDTKLEAQEV